MTTAVLHTSLGDIRITLFDNHAPKTVKNFVGLSDGTLRVDRSSDRPSRARAPCTPT